MIGIYKIKNKVNGKVYIGQSIDIKRRWYAHKNELGRQVHCNSHMQKSWNKYGEENFEFSILEECDLNDIDEKEIFWISYYNSANQDFGYNLTDGGQGIHGYIPTEEWKNLMYKMSKAEPVLQFDMDGNLLERWRSAAWAGRSLNIPISGIRQCVKLDGDQYQCHGYIWLLETTYNNKNFNIETYIDTYFPKKKRIFEYDLYGKLIHIWNDNRELLENGDSSVEKILKACLEKRRRSHNGSIYLYEDDDFVLTDDYLRDIRIKTYRYKINQFDQTGKLLKTWATDELKNSEYNFSTVRNRCTSNYMGHTDNLTYKKFIWKYE